MTPVSFEFGHWFSGFVDGEGCFTIHKKGGCSFIIGLRSDDELVLRHIQNSLGGIGRIRYVFRSLGSEGGNPQIRWEVNKKKECLWLTTVFDAYPLRSRKANDYAIWREAAVLHAAGTHPALLDPYRVRLMDVRRYRGATKEAFENG